MVARCKVVLSGTVGNGADIWQTGFHMPAVSGFSSGDLQTLADNINDTWLSEVWNVVSPGILNSWAGTVDYRETRVNDVNGAGITVRVRSAAPAEPVVGSSGSASLPTEVAEVVTLQTETAGLRGRGRMYLPPFGANFPISIGVMSASDVLATAEAMASFFTTLNATSPIPGPAGVYSTVDNVVRSITSVKVGNVFDSQRRRRNSIVETYVIEPVTI